MKQMFSRAKNAIRSLTVQNRHAIVWRKNEEVLVPRASSPTSEVSEESTD